VQSVRNIKFLNRLAKNLKKARKAKGLTQEELAFKSGLALSQIARIETGRLNSSVCTIYVLLQALEIDANKLFE